MRCLSRDEEASTNVQTVAAATEQPSASINEISRQVVASTSITGEAVVQAERRRGPLADAAQRIGDVVKLISGIAEQTNLLALNASVSEAAGKTGAAAGEVLVSAKGLDRLSEAWRDNVDRFVGNIRAA